MNFRFFADNEPVNFQRLPPVGGSVLAKRMVPLRVEPQFPRSALTWSGLLPLAVGAAVYASTRWIGPWNPFDQALVVGMSALPLASVLLRYLSQGLYGRVMRWPSLASEFSTWGALVDALKDSPYTVRHRGETVRERDHLFLGLIAKIGKPFLLNTVYLNRPAIILGRTGAGKTKLVAEAILRQVIARRTHHALVVDLKVDKSFMLGLGQEAARARVDFKWLTLEPGKSSYLWNPFTDPGVRLLAQEQFIQIILRALSLVTTQVHGAGYFGAMQEERTRRTFEQNVLRSCREFYRVVREQRPADIGMNERDFSNAGHLIANLARIASVGVLNAVPGDDVPEAALRHAISTTDILSRPGVTYFALPSQLEPTTAMFVAKLLVHLLAAVAMVHQGPRVPVLVWFDEFQEVVSGGGTDLATPIRQARESGVNFWMGFQDLAALQGAEGDFTNTLLGNTPLKVFCTAEDDIGRDYIKRSSGETFRSLQSVSETTTQSPEGSSRSTGVQFREEAIPRIGDECINEVNRDPNAFIAFASESKGFSQYRFPVVVRSTFPASPRELDRRQAMPWPRGNRFTVSIEPTRLDGPPDAAPQAAPAPTAGPQGGASAATPTPAPSEAVTAPPQVAATPPRRRGRPPKRAQVDAAAPTASVAERTGTSEMAEYLKRLAEESTGEGEQGQ